MPLSFRLASALLLTLFLCVPARAQSPLDLAQSHWYAGRHAQALEVLDGALTKDPNNARLRFTQAWMLQERGETARAEGLLSRLLEDFPDHAEGHNNLAVILAQRGDLEGARRALERAVQLQPEHAQAQENLGDVLLRLAQRAYGQAARAPQAGATLQLKIRQLDALLRAPAR